MSKNTEVKTIILPIRKRSVGISRKIKKDNPIPKIGNNEEEGKRGPTG